MRNCFEMCVYTLLKANPMGERVKTYALKGKKTAFTTYVDYVDVRVVS